jgi:LmbE family N-acetylglucosaminyl deacetylase
MRMVSYKSRGAPNILLHFIQDVYIKPDIVIDITDYWDKKIESVNAYGSQFYNPEWEEEPQTYISSPDLLQLLKHAHANLERVST